MSQEPARKPIRILLADDHPIVLRGVADFLESETEFEVVGRCTDGGECIAAIRNIRPDVALIDIMMPKLTGLEVLSAVRRENLPTRVVFFTATSRSGDIISALNDGAHGIILKDEAPDRVLGALREVAAGGRWLPQELIDTAFERDSAWRGKEPKLSAILSEREREVARMAGIGLSNKVIADRLQITEGTIKNHLHNIYEKLGVANRTALALLLAPNRRR
jgi:two-component system, NarL family, nitrate/nitrite response regulator NarL